VPAGRYARPAIVNREKLVRVADALSSPGVRLVFGSFESAREITHRGDFLYVDPPDAPLSRTANFTSYTASRFGGEDQARLQQLVLDVARRGCHVLVQQLDGAGNRRALRKQLRGTRRRPADISRAGAARHQQQRRTARGDR
jgi:DNA adenine methylase